MNFQEAVKYINNSVSAIEICDKAGIPVKKIGTNYSIKCPDSGHTDAHYGNCIVYPQKGRRHGGYKCFACGSTGTNADIIMKVFNLSFYEAIGYISRFLGLEWEDDKEDGKSLSKTSYLRIGLRAPFEDIEQLKREDPVCYRYIVQGKANEKLDDLSLQLYQDVLDTCGNNYLKLIEELKEKNPDFADVLTEKKKYAKSGVESKRNVICKSACIINKTIKKMGVADNIGRKAARVTSETHYKDMVKEEERILKNLIILSCM